MCRFSHQDTKWNLLYRASKDGFGASVFHTKCDNKPNTLTIIKTSQGYIFGGYTEADWSKTDPIRFQDLLFNPLHLSATRTGSKLNFKYDPEAFIFSLKNPENRILRIDVSNPNEAIHSHQLYGPSFGNGDILIVSDSNTHIYSFSDLSSSYVHPDITSTSDKIKSERFLTGSKHFKVADIEVFQKN